MTTKKNDQPLVIVAIVAIVAITSIFFAYFNNTSPDDALTNELTTITGEAVKLSRCADYLSFCESGKKNSPRFCDIYSQYCTDSCVPTAEVCNGRDDDCDDQVDEGLSAVCGIETGICEFGYRTCSAGSWSGCSGGVNPSIESCNGLDDDCDGQVDEDETCVDQNDTITIKTSYFPFTATSISDEQGALSGTQTGIIDRVSDNTNAALSFSGQGYIDLGSDNYVDDISDQVTVAAWVKPSQTGSYQGIIMHGGPNTDTFALYLYPSGQLIGFKTTGTTNDWYTAAAPTLFDNNWHHVAAVYDGSRKVIYLDGIPLISTQSFGDIESGSGYRLLLGAGRDEANPTLLYDGMLDDVYISNEAKSDTAIAELAMTNTVPLEETCQPVAEICNGVDDDCDTTIDEGTLCSSGYSCQGANGCVANEPDCVPKAEACNGLDDDCDDAIDEGSLCSNGYTCQGYSGCVADPSPDPDDPFVCPSGHTCYYVASNGNDAYSGTSPSTPWKTLSKVNSQSFSPGDYIVFNKGDSWTGSLTITSSGTSSNPITYAAYGTGNKPIIYGSTPITGWTHHSGNIYKASFDQDITQLFMNGARLRSAREPNNGYFYIDSVAGDTTTSRTFTSYDLNAGTNYQGSTAIIRTREWYLSTNTITSANGQQLTINANPPYDLNPGEGFVLFGKLSFLDQAGEWYYDSASDTIYLWTPSGADPDNYEIRASTANNLVEGSSKDYLVIEDLQLSHAAQKGIYLYNSDYVTINNCDIDYSAVTGIDVQGSSSHVTIIGNTINHATDYGIYARSSYSSSQNYHTIEDNAISNIGLFDEIGVAGIGGQRGTGIALAYAGNSKIRYNTITNVGYNGIHFYYSPDTIIEYNYVYGACLTIDDGGGIYGFEGGDTEYSDGTIIRYNIVDHMVGSNEGYPKTLLQAVGIYLDDRLSYITVENNIIKDVSNLGFFFHNNKYSTFRNNVVVDSQGGYRITENYGATGNILEDNTFLNSANVPANAVIGMVNPDHSSIARVNNNHYIDHHRAKPFRQMNNYAYLTFSEWRSATGYDASSAYDNSPLSLGQNEELIYNNERTAKTYYLNGANAKDEQGNTIPSSFTLQPFTSKILIGTNLDAITTT